PAEGERITIDHAAATCVVAGRMSRLRACPQPEADVVSARVLFRAKGRGPWSAVEMQRDGSCYSALLPAPKQDVYRLQYYIEVRDLTYAAWTSTQYEAKVTLRPESCATPFVSEGDVAVTAVDGSAVVPDGFSGRGVHTGGSSGVTALAVVGAGAAIGGTV